MNLFLVTSPLQYICALEAKEYFSCNDSILILVNQKSKHGLDQQRKIVQREDWSEIIEIERDNRSFRIPQTIKKLKKKLNKGTFFERFFYAEYNAWWTKILIKNLPIRKEVYFDDGTLTLSEYYKLIVTKKSFYRPRLIQDFIIRLQGLKPIGLLPQSESLEVFTIFDLQKKHIALHKNSLNRLKSSYNNPNLFTSIAPLGFIGQGAVGDKNQISIQDYLKIIENLNESYNSKIIYFPHRTERKEVKEAIMNLDYVTYHKSDYPLEIELIDKNIKLSALVGTLSTVMFTCRLLYPNMPIYTLEETHRDKIFQDELTKQLNKIDVKNFKQFVS